MNQSDKFAELARRCRAEGVEIDTVLRTLRDEGATIIESVKAIREVESVSLGTAKEIVDASTVWADHFAGNDDLRGTAIDALENAD